MVNRLFVCFTYLFVYTRSGVGSVENAPEDYRLEALDSIYVGGSGCTPKLYPVSSNGASGEE